MAVGEEHLPEGRAVSGEPLTETLAGHYEARSRLGVQVENLVVLKATDVGRFTQVRCQGLENGAGVADKAAAAGEGATQLQAAGSQPVSLALALVDVAALVQRGEKPKDVVLVEVQTSGEFGHTELFVLTEALEKPKCVRHGLDDVVALLSLHRGDGPGGAASSRPLDDQRFFTFSQSARNRSRPESVKG